MPADRAIPIADRRDWRHPGFAPYLGDAERLAAAAASAGDWIAEADALARARGLRSGSGAALRFMTGGLDRSVDCSAVGDLVGGAIGYERRIHEAGVVACRGPGRGGLHDLHNALVWLRWPALKAALNRLHVGGAPAGAPAGSPGDAAPARAGAAGRGRRRDAATLFDENGVVWTSSDPALDRLLVERRWQALFVDRRAEVARRVRVHVVGHGLLEKLHRPYRAMTGHVLVLPLAGDASASAGAGASAGPSGADPVAGLDARLADRIETMARAGRFEPAALCPLPVLGLPGWDPANDHPSYYADARVFRPARSGPHGN